MDDERLDAWIPAPAVRARHGRIAAADANALWAAAAQVRLADTGRLGRLVRWRIPGLDPRLTYHELLRGYPFTVLEEGARVLVSGLCGRIWTLARDYPELADAAAFSQWSQPGTVRVALAHSVRELPDGRSELVSEARVQPTDRAAALRLRALWALVGPFERLIATEPLALAARTAEAMAAPRPSSAR